MICHSAHINPQRSRLSQNTNQFIAVIMLFVFLSAGCHSKQETVNYTNKGLSFEVPATWVVKEDYRAPGSRRSVSIETPDTSLILIEMYSKDVLLDLPEYQSYDASLKQFAIRYNGRDIAGKLQAAQPISQVSINRNNVTGLKETQKFIIGEAVNDTMVREYYRVDTDKEIVFIIMDTSEDEYQTTATGLDTILSSFKYQ